MGGEERNLPEEGAVPWRRARKFRGDLGDRTGFLVSHLEVLTWDTSEVQSPLGSHLWVGTSG